MRAVPERLELSRVALTFGWPGPTPYTHASWSRDLASSEFRFGSWDGCTPRTAPPMRLGASGFAIRRCCFYKWRRIPSERPRDSPPASISWSQILAPSRDCADAPVAERARKSPSRKSPWRRTGSGRRWKRRRRRTLHGRQFLRGDCAWHWQERHHCPRDGSVWPALRLRLRCARDRGCQSLGQGRAAVSRLRTQFSHGPHFHRLG